MNILNGVTGQIEKPTNCVDSTTYMWDTSESSTGIKKIKKKTIYVTTMDTKLLNQIHWKMLKINA